MAADTNKPKTSFWVVLILLGVFLAGANIYFLMHPLETKVEIEESQEAETAPEFAIPAFEFTDQEGAAFSSARLEGQVWIADFIFTRCPGPCLRMSRAMAQVQELLAEYPDIHLVSFSVDPEYDTPGVLKAYGEQQGSDFARWTFLTGDRQKLHDLSINGFKLALMEASESELPETGPYIHSTRLVVVDRSGVTRGYFDGLEEENLPKVAELALELRNAGKKD